jgi:BNR repeat-like domain
MMGHRVPSVAGSLAAVVALSLPAAASGATVGPLSVASGPSPFAACTTGLDPGPGPGTNFLNAEVEPFVAVNPRNAANVVGVFQQDRWSNGGARGLVTAASFDGGATWTRTFQPFSKCSGNGDYDRASDPWVSFGPDGRAYQVSLSASADLTLSAILASTSTDGGLTWAPPVTIQRDLSPNRFVFNDKESVTADPHTPGTAYVVWDRSRFPSDSSQNPGTSRAFRGDPTFSKTTNGGATWSIPRDIMPQNQNIATIGNQLVVLPNGTLVDVYVYFKGVGGPNQSLEGVQRSTDGGATWSKPIEITNNTVTRVVDPETGVPLRTGSDIGGGLPDIATDPRTGALYVVFEDNRFSGGAHNDIALSKSMDGGLTWSAPVKVNQTTGGATAFTPSVDVLPNGTVAVTYYDWRNNTPAAGLPTDEFVAVSSNGGTTFTEQRVTPTSFDVENAPVARGYFLGDYEGLANNGTAFKSFFVQTIDESTTNKTDVFATTVTP